MKQIFIIIWKEKIPLKIQLFLCRLIMGRLPTKDQLLRRNLSHINDDLNCPLFGEEKVLGSVEEML